MHICLLTSGRVFELAYGGETRYTLSLGNWLAMRDHNVTLIGTGFASIKAKSLSKFDVEENKKSKKIRVLYPPMSVYLLSRLVLSLICICKILLINRKSPITLIHVQETGYCGLSAIVSGKLLRIPVIISSHGIRHKALEPNIQSRLRKILLKVEYSLDFFTTKNADKVIAVNSSIKKYYEQKISKNRCHWRGQCNFRSEFPRHDYPQQATARR